MTGPKRSERREAPIRCGFARTYEPGLQRRKRLRRPNKRSLPCVKLRMEPNIRPVTGC